MRYITTILTPDNGYFHPGEEVMRQHGLIPEGIHNLDLLDDDTITVMYAVRGNANAAEECMENYGEGCVHEYQIIDESDNIIIQAHMESTEFIKGLINYYRNYAIIMNYPQRFVDPSDSSIRITQIGPEDYLQEFVEKMPDEVDVTIEEIGDYNPFDNRLFANLTDRQQEVLITAYENGYFNTPREVTHKDIADELNCSAGTVSHHLQQIQAHLVRQIIPKTKLQDTNEYKELINDT